jgi:hypothetical protein
MKRRWGKQPTDALGDTILDIASLAAAIVVIIVLATLNYRLQEQCSWTPSDFSLGAMPQATP